MRFAARILAAGLLAIGLSVGLAVAASASTSFTVTFSDSLGSNTVTRSCNSGPFWISGEYVSHVANGCGTRVWIHGTDSGGGASYCINPGAGASNRAFGNGYVQVAPSGNTQACDAGVTFDLGWGAPPVELQIAPDCIDGSTDVTENGDGVGELDNFCNTRIWLHANRNGSGATACISPGGTFIDNALGGSGYLQVQVSGNQDPC